jgi:hypothetical protein
MHPLWIAFTVVVVCSATGSAYGSPTPTNEPRHERVTLEADATAIAPSAEERAWRSARNEEMQARQQQRDAEIELLHAQLAAGPTPLQAHAIHQQIARIKVETELDLFEIQARFARLAGDEDGARRIEEFVAARREALRGAASTTSHVEPREE